MKTISFLPFGGGEPPKVVEGHPQVSVNGQGSAMPHLPLHHAAHGPPPLLSLSKDGEEL